MKSNWIAQLCLLCLFSLSSQFCFAELAIIVHPKNTLQVLSKAELKRIYLGVTEVFPNGLLISAVDQPKQSSMKREFYKKVVGKGLPQVSAYWSRRIFTGKGVPPRALKSDGEIKAWIASHPESIAYIDVKNVDHSVKTIFSVK